MRQLVLDLPVEARFGVDDFLVSPSNEEAYAVLERWPDWPDPLLHLQGPPGAGKSHLAAIWAERAQAMVLPSRNITDDRVAQLASQPALALEDLDRGPLDEGALFHLLNLARENRSFLLVTSAVPLGACGIATADLLSRLRLAPSVKLGPPDDALLKAVLVKLFLDRQLVVDTTVIDFITNRMERSLGEAAQLVAALDREALSRGRRVTRPVAAEILARDADLAGSAS